MSDAVLIGGAAAVAAYALTRREEGKVVHPAPVKGKKPIAGMSVSLKTAYAPGGIGTIVGGFATKAATPGAIYTATGSSGAGSDAVKNAMEKAKREAEAYVSAEYNKLGQAAKEAGAAALNKALKLSPPLTGKESYKDVARIAGSAAGAAGCSAIGLGVGAPICAMAGAYLGVKGADLAKKAYSKSVDAAKAVGNAVGGAAKDAWNYIF